MQVLIPNCEYYKICSTINKEYFSVFCLHSYIKQYEIEKWTYLDIGKLFVFDSLQSATYFQNFSKSSNTIFTCKVVNTVSCLTVSSVSYNRPTLDYSIYKFWNNEISGCKAPSGSLLCDAVKLIERIG